MMTLQLDIVYHPNCKEDAMELKEFNQKQRKRADALLRLDKEQQLQMQQIEEEQDELDDEVILSSGDKILSNKYYFKLKSQKKSSSLKLGLSQDCLFTVLSKRIKGGNILLLTTE